MARMVTMAHIDAKGVGARAMQLGNHLGIGAGGAKGRQDAHLALAGGKILDHKCSERMKKLGPLA